MEDELIKKAKTGNITAFEELISLYEKKIFNYCFRMTNNREDAEDLAQEIFIKVYKNLKSFKGNSRFATWLYRIAYNTCVDNSRKKKTVSVSLTFHKEDNREKEVPSQDPTPEEKVIRHEDHCRIQECIASLRPEYKSVIILRDMQNYTYEEISDILNIPMGTVKSHISRARAALREALKNHETAYMEGVE